MTEKILKVECYPTGTVQIITDKYIHTYNPKVDIRSNPGTTKWIKSELPFKVRGE